MGQKVNPNGIRLGINKTWSSRWFSKSEYSKLLHQDLEIKKYVEQKLKNASVSKINIERAAKKLRISIYSSRPGIIIGKKGADIETLKNKLLDDLNPNYKTFYYKKTFMNKTEILQNLNQSPKTMNNDILRYFCDVLKINCLYIDIETKKYKLFKCFNQEVVVDNIVVIGYNKNILPLVNIRYDKFTYKDLLKIKDYFKEVVTLKKISAYSMVELVELAEDNKINVKHTETNKKKTKQMLYDELKKIFE